MAARPWEMWFDAGGSPNPRTKTRHFESELAACGALVEVMKNAGPGSRAGVRYSPDGARKPWRHTVLVAERYGGFKMTVRFIGPGKDE